MNFANLDFKDVKAVREEFNQFYEAGLGQIFYMPITSDPEVLRKHLMKAEVEDF